MPLRFLTWRKKCLENLNDGNILRGGVDLLDFEDFWVSAEMLTSFLRLIACDAYFLYECWQRGGVALPCCQVRSPQLTTRLKCKLTLSVQKKIVLFGCLNLYKTIICPPKSLVPKCVLCLFEATQFQCIYSGCTECKRNVCDSTFTSKLIWAQYWKSGLWSISMPVSCNSMC